MDPSAEPLSHHVIKLLIHRLEGLVTAGFLARRSGFSQGRLLFEDLSSKAGKQRKQRQHHSGGRGDRCGLADILFFASQRAINIPSTKDGLLNKRRKGLCLQQLSPKKRNVLVHIQFNPSSEPTVCLCVGYFSEFGTQTLPAGGSESYF